MIIRDQFIDDFKGLKSHAMSADFERKVNEVDGAVYPAISFDIPAFYVDEIVGKIEAEKGFKIEPALMFFRRNELGAPEPYQAHNDLNMSEFTFILYFGDKGGTAFVKHIETGMDHNQPEFADEWLRDCNKPEAWEVTDFCNMRPNRGMFFDATRMHRGEPVEGYGSDGDARTILVCFYNRAENDQKD